MGAWPAAGAECLGSARHWTFFSRCGPAPLLPEQACVTWEADGAWGAHGEGREGAKEPRARSVLGELHTWLGLTICSQLPPLGLEKDECGAGGSGWLRSVPAVSWTFIKLLLCAERSPAPLHRWALYCSAILQARKESCVHCKRNSHFEP